MSPDEICASNIKLLKKICKDLHDLHTSIDKTLLKKFSAFDPVLGNPIEIGYTHFYKLLVANQNPVNEIKEKIGEDAYTKETLLETLTHVYISDPESLSRKLNGICEILFKDITLIFVSKIKGYYINKDLSKITFERVTGGAYPRFQAKI